MFATEMNGRFSRVPFTGKKFLEICDKILRKRAQKRHPFFCSRVFKGKSPCVQQESRMFFPEECFAAIQFISDDRVADCLHVDTYLMRSSGMDRDTQK